MSEAWKCLERTVAAVLGGERVGVTGEATPDVTGVKDYLGQSWLLECKWRSSSWICSTYREEKSKRKTRKNFALVIRARGFKPLVVLALDDFAALLHGPPSDGGQTELEWDEE